MKVLYRSAWLSTRGEILFLMVLAGLVFCGVPLMLGHIGFSWDGLNHHIYLGWSAEHERFGRDIQAAGTQVYQFPYLYWLPYRLMHADINGALAGAIINIQYLLSVPAVWLICKAGMPQNTVFDQFCRILGSILAFTSCVSLSFLDTTANDWVAAIPMLWAVAFTVLPTRSTQDQVGTPKIIDLTKFIVAGFFVGMAVAFKLSNGPLSIVFPVFWMYVAPGSLVRKSMYMICACLSVLFGFLVIYGYWGSVLWQYFGNPIYPYYDNLFETARRVFGWQP
ncbi:hypothetical protein [Curvibacter lanceolatus]|uniref:hypothetical protein n=1 Tax=Curvibacter lanceolatus TaxID=86182 RepID=UPI0012FCCDE3|nr:hypothetical protein [Curvibacter lanceolatus]